MVKILKYIVNILKYIVKILKYMVKILKYIVKILKYGQTSTLISIKLIYTINYTTDVLILNNIYYKTKYINFMQYFNIEIWVLIIKY